jgi:tetratricopeptide (TPR) repeat protein
MTTESASIDDRYRLASESLAIGDVGGAEGLLKQLIAAKPDEARAHNLLGSIAYGADKFPAAAEHFAQAIRLDPANGDYYSDLALALSRMGEHEAAITGFRASIHLKPDGPAAHNNLGTELQSQGQFAEAAVCFRKALALYPDFVAAYNNLGCVLREMGKPALALAPLEKALALSPQTAELHNSLANVLRDLGRLDDAIFRYSEAIRLKPDHVHAHNSLGSVYCDQGRLDEAMARQLEVLGIEPDCADAHTNLGVVWQRMGRPDLAVRAYRDAIRLDPKTTTAQTNLAMALLLQGDYAEGWRLYEKRWLGSHLKLAVRTFEQPQWNGEREPKRLLIHAEQGFGDTLQFCRYLPLIDPRHKIIFEVEAPLVDLMRQLPGVDTVIARGAPLPEFDAHCPIMSLPFVFGTTLDTIPNRSPYLRAGPEQVGGWAKRMEPVKGLRVGLVWAGGARPNQPELAPTNRRRSMNLASLAPLAQARGVSFISLQKGPPASEVQAAPPGMTLFDFTDDLHDFTDTAALVETLDLVIGVDTAVAHLAAAMGKPVWLLNRFDTCWRWLMNRDDSPWYPTLRLFRQPAPGDWDSVTADIAAALQHAADLSQDRATPMVRAA